MCTKKRLFWLALGLVLMPRETLIKPPFLR